MLKRVPWEHTEPSPNCGGTCFRLLTGRQTILWAALPKQRRGSEEAARGGFGGFGGAARGDAGDAGGMDSDPLYAKLEAVRLFADNLFLPLVAWGSRADPHAPLWDRPGGGGLAGDGGGFAAEDGGGGSGGDGFAPPPGSAGDQEAGKAPFSGPRDKFHTVVLRGVGNVSEAP